MKTNFEKSKKYIVIVLFLVAAVLSVVFVNRVSINYNMSDYLDDSTETRVALDIIEDEFGMTADIQVMIEDISVVEAKDVCDTLESIPDVLAVNFDEYDESYYKDGNALFIVIVDGDEYSDVANTVLAEVKDALDETFSGKIGYDGAVIAKANLRDSIEGEIPFILAVAICLVAAIMLLTSKSWIEPIILLFVSGVAILINMGTNAFLGEISYITNAVAAILQLALSIDYSIVLLHSYRTLKETEEDKGTAMSKAIRSVVKPVSASALTTISGLLALLFMSFKIGFDIGIVLMKGIVISAVASLTLLPALLLLFDKPMSRTEKKEITLRGGPFCNFAYKSNKIVVPVAIVLIVVCCVLQFGNSYTFTDSESTDSMIAETFGRNNTVVVVYPNVGNGYADESKLIDKLDTYKTADGKLVLKNYSAYGNTVRELYDVKTAAQKLDLAESDVEMLLTMYHLYGDCSLVELKTSEFVKYADALISGDADAADFTDEETIKTIRTMIVVDEIMNNDHTAEEFFTLATTGVMEGTDLDLFSIKQTYGLYFYDEVSNKSVDFKTMLDYLISAADKTETKDMFDARTVSDLTSLSDGIEQFNRQMEQPLTKVQFQGYMYQNYGVLIDDATAAQIYAGYYYSIGQAEQETIPFLKLMTFLVDQNQITDASSVAAIREYEKLYATIYSDYPYEEFLTTLSKIATALSGTEPEINTTDLAVQQVYVMYFYEQNSIPVTSVSGRVFVDFVNSTVATNSVVSDRLSADGKAKLSDICLVDEFLTDTELYDFQRMADRLTELQSGIKSMASSAELNGDKVSGVYIKYAIGHGYALTDAVAAKDLVDFVIANMDTNELLTVKMSSDQRDKVIDARDDISDATELFVGKNYSRMLLSVDLPDESEDSTEFIEYLTAAVKETFGEGAHIAGVMVSTYDLQETFDKDNTLISIFTIVSIFLVIMLVFRSFSLPVILVVVIQGAIWIAMSTSLITGPMFFMSYIVTVCILMGATVDYGILMSTNYVKYRATLDKKEALLKSVEAAMPTVFTSGTILTVCGLVIGIIASQPAISTVGLLICKGALVSVLMVMLVLPSALYLLDGFILKLSVKTKKRS